MNVTVQVECYSGHSYAQEPRAFEWRGQRYQVVRVIKRWRTPTGPAFRVEATVVKNQLTNGKHQMSNDKYQVPKSIDLNYLELEDVWTVNVQN